MAREVLHAILNQEALYRPIQVGIVEAHRDDVAMTGGFAEALADHPDVGVSVITLTDGAARIHKNYSQETMRLARRTEGPPSVAMMKGAQLICADIPGDGRLGEEVYRKEGEDFLKQVFDGVKPDLLIVPSLEDHLLDHRTAAEITQVVTQGELPLYFMDTINGTDRSGNPIFPTHVIPLEEELVARRRDSFMANTSQTTDLPPDEMGAVFDVLGMPGRRGKENGGGYAGVLIFDAKNSLHDPIAKLFPGAQLLEQPNMGDRLLYPEVPLNPASVVDNLHLVTSSVGNAIAQWKGVTSPDQFKVFETDPLLTTSEEVCKAYGIPLNLGAKTLIVKTKGDQPQYAACLVPSETRADLNGVVKRELGVGQVSVASQELAEEVTGMPKGSMTVIGLPEGFPIFVDESLVGKEQVVLGSGLLNSKLIVPGSALVDLPNVSIIQGLGVAKPATIG